MKDLTSTPPCSLRDCDTMAIPLAVACALARIASASPDLTKKKRKETVTQEAQRHRGRG